MTDLSPIEQSYKSIQKSLMNSFDSDLASPAPIKGSNREVFLANFLKRLFPKQIRFGSGLIVDRHQKISGQCDIVAEWQWGPSLQIDDDSTRYYFADLVAAVISVKSDLKKQWPEVETEMKKLSGVDFTVGVNGKRFSPWERKCPLFVIGYKGFSSVENARDAFQKAPYDNDALGILTIENGVYVSGIRGKRHSHQGWQGLHCLISDLVDVSTGVMMEPVLGNYLTSQPENF